MTEMDFDEVVFVLETSHAVELGVGGSTGVVLGKSRDVDGIIYAVLVGGETFMIPESGLVSAGHWVASEESSSVESVKVQAERYSGE
ncbi:hypothetical protein [Streptomyces sp. Sge12]|uniref:hypothetical protein n=1 Tax=Streptomyces sp. Sge12 TaxID=1972846 RepID=UPI001331C0D1|nr:hypothetical protein [Streptomyces sp. Sge12]